MACSIFPISLYMLRKKKQIKNKISLGKTLRKWKDFQNKSMSALTMILRMWCFSGSLYSCLDEWTKSRVVLVERTLSSMHTEAPQGLLSIDWNSTCFLIHIMISKMLIIVIFANCVYLKTTTTKTI